MLRDRLCPQRLLLALIAVGAAAPVCAQIYAGTNGTGAVVLSNFQTNETPELVIAPPAALSTRAAALVSRPFS